MTHGFLDPSTFLERWEQKTHTPKTRFSERALLRTPGRLTTRPFPANFATTMFVVRPVCWYFYSFSQSRCLGGPKWGVLKWGCFPHFLLAFPGLLAIHWSYGTCHMNETSTPLCLVLLQKQATKCSTPDALSHLCLPTVTQLHFKFDCGSLEAVRMS